MDREFTKFVLVRPYPRRVQCGPVLSAHSTVQSGHIRAQFSAVRSYPHTVQYSPAISAHSTVRSGHIRTNYSTVRPYPLSVQYGPALFPDSDSIVANVNFANHSFVNKNKARAFYG